jgi:hypothetical protein
MSRRTRILIVTAVSLAAAGATLLRGPMPQPADYHSFADQRTLLGIPNFLDVASNLPFLIVGLMGLSFVTSRRRRAAAFQQPPERLPWLLVFAGMTLTSAGSSYYHWAPSNATLLWDRLPMTLAFMGFFAAVISERVDFRAGVRWLLPLAALGIASVFYWYGTELRGAGDLRVYAMVQFAPLLAIPLLVAFFAPRYTRGSYVVLVVALYLVAKGLELLDRAIFSLGGIVSGHTLKHLAAAAAGYWLLRMLRTREPIVPLRRAPV